MPHPLNSGRGNQCSDVSCRFPAAGFNRLVEREAGRVEGEAAKMAARPISSYFRSGLSQTGAKVSLKLGRAAIGSGQNGCQTNCSLLSLQSESDRGESQGAIGEGCMPSERAALAKRVSKPPMGRPVATEGFPHSPLDSWRFFFSSHGGGSPLSRC